MLYDRYPSLVATGFDELASDAMSKETTTGKFARLSTLPPIDSVLFLKFLCARNVAFGLQFFF